MLERCEPGQAIIFGRNGVAWPTVYMITMDGEESQRTRDKTLARFQSVEEKGGMGTLNKLLVMASKEDSIAELGRVASWIRHQFSVIIPSGILYGSDIDVVAFMISRQARVESDDLHAQPQYIPQWGEIVIRAAFRKALTQALDSGAEYFAIMEDDVVPSENFIAEFSTLMEKGCGRYMSRYTGVLLLGSSNWAYDGHWSLVDQAMEKDHYMCHDAHRYTIGAFAALYNRNAARLILHEMDRWPNVPYDHIFYRLALRGAFLSVAYPNLVIMDHWNKTSRVNQTQWEGSTLKHQQKEMVLRLGKSRWDSHRYKWSTTSR